MFDFISLFAGEIALFKAFLIAGISLFAELFLMYSIPRIWASIAGKSIGIQQREATMQQVLMTIGLVLAGFRMEAIMDMAFQVLQKFR